MIKSVSTAKKVEVATTNIGMVVAGTTVVKVLSCLVLFVWLGLEIANISTF